MVSGTPRLRKLIVKGEASENDGIVGELSCLELVQDTLTHLELRHCGCVEGSIADLGNFPRLECLDLRGTRGIEKDDFIAQRSSFPSLKDLDGWTYSDIASDLSQRSIEFTFDRLESLLIEVDSFSLSLLRFVPNLRSLICSEETHVEGDLRDLRFLRSTLCTLDLGVLEQDVTGSFGDIRDFPILRHLNLWGCNKLSPASPSLCPSDFPSLKTFDGHVRLSFVAEASSLMQLLACRGVIDVINASISASVTKESPDFYDPDPQPKPLITPESAMHLSSLSKPPFTIQILKAGSRFGWRWRLRKNKVYAKYCFETNWLNDEPRRDDEEHWTKKDLGPFVGLHDPPKTKEEYESIVLRFVEKSL